MGLLEIIAVLITLAALFSYANHRWLKLPTTIGVMLIGLVVSLGLIAAGTVAPGVQTWAEELLTSVDFNETVMHGLLGFLLFAGALHVNINDLADRKLTITLLATCGVLISTFVIGGLMWQAFRLVGLETPLIYCLLFGSLISPTDPIAVLGILKTLGVPKSLETKIAGESLFNDGIGVVVFLVFFGLAGLDPQHDHMSTAVVARLFLTEAVGGALFGMTLGLIAYKMLKSIDSYQVEVLISLALVAGGYALATRLHLSGPIAMVVAGLLIGNHGRALAMSARTREHLDTFWELIDEILNAVLFVLMGLEMIVLSFTEQYLLAGLLAIPIVLAARLFAVGLPMGVLRLAGREFTPHSVKVLTWGGLRGGISVALALSIPKIVNGTALPARDLIVAVTYCVVVFSILVQGLTVGPLVRKLDLRQADHP